MLQLLTMPRSLLIPALSCWQVKWKKLKSNKHDDTNKQATAITVNPLDLMLTLLTQRRAVNIDRVKMRKDVLEIKLLEALKQEVERWKLELAVAPLYQRRLTTRSRILNKGRLEADPARSAGSSPPTFSFPIVWDCHQFYELTVALGKGRPPMTSSDAETDTKPIIIIFFFFFYQFL